MLLEQLAHQLDRCSLVAPPLHEQIENLAFVLDGAKARTACRESLGVRCNGSGFFLAFRLDPSGMLRLPSKARMAARIILPAC